MGTLGLSQCFEYLKMYLFKEFDEIDKIRKEVKYEQ